MKYIIRKIVNVRLSIVLLLCVAIFYSFLINKNNTKCIEIYLSHDIFSNGKFKDSLLLVDSSRKDSLQSSSSSNCKNTRINKFGFCRSILSEEDCQFVQNDITKLYYKSLIINEYRKLSNDSSARKTDTVHLVKSTIPTIPDLEDLYDSFFSTWKIYIDITPYLCDSNLIIDKYKLYEIVVAPTTLDSRNSGSITITTTGDLKYFPRKFKILIAFREENPHYSNRLLYIAGDIPLDYNPEIIKANSFEQQVELYNKIKKTFENSLN